MRKKIIGCFFLPINVFCNSLITYKVLSNEKFCYASKYGYTIFTYTKKIILCLTCSKVTYFFIH